MTLNPTQALRKKLRFRCWHRGTKEMDLMLGRFADTYVDGFNDQQLKDFEDMLSISDPDLYNWASGREPVPAEQQDNKILELFLNAQNK